MPVFKPDQVAKLRKRAAKKRAQAEGMMREFNHYRQDHAFIFQPRMGTSFDRRRDKIFAQYRKGSEIMLEAEKLEERADRYEKYGFPVAGDREKARQARREAADQVITVGSRISDPILGHGTVTKVNKKTYRVNFDRGFSQLTDKSWAKLLPSQE